MNAYDSLSRSDWLGLADRFYARLRQELAAFTPGDWDRVSPYLGWRNRDLLAHMASAIPVNFRQVLDRAAAGDPSAPSEFNTFARNGREVARRRKVPVADTLQEFWSGLDQILSIYRGMSDSGWLAPAWFFVGRVNVRTLFLAQLGDNVFHERDLLLVTGKWKGLDPQVSAPLVDWFLRELRPTLFRPEKATGLNATALYRLTGNVSGEWTMRIENGACRVDRASTHRPDVMVAADAEDLVVASQGRAAPFVGMLARAVDWLAGPNRKEDFVAKVTGYGSALPAILSGRIRATGDRRLANRVRDAFWHFWERTEQTERNIAAGA